jgi:cell division ATPase FtsA
VLSQAENIQRIQENHLILALQQHKKAVKEHIEKWTKRTQAAEAKTVATARAREILQLLPGAAALGPAGLYRLGAKFQLDGPHPDGEPTLSVLF